MSTLDERMAEQVRKVCAAYRVPPWIVGVERRPRWPRRAWYWLRGYRPARFVAIMPRQHGRRGYRPGVRIRP